MLKRIELTNFMSHRHTVIEPAPGLTVLVGPNNVGKSAIVAALQILCHNEKSTYVTRHGEKECSVTVETDDGHIIRWKRKKSPSYEIDGESFDRLGQNSVPDELHKVLRLPAVEGAAGDQFDVHFGAQKTPIFLLGDKGSAAARFFASSSDATRLVEMQKLHKDKHAEAKRDKRRLEAESSQLNVELSALEPIVPLDAQLEEAEQAYALLLKETAAIEELDRQLQGIIRQSATLDRLEALADALAVLTPPPELPSVERLEEAIDAQEHVSRDLMIIAERLKSLGELPAPPVMQDAAALEVCLRDLSDVAQHARGNDERHHCLQHLCAPPTLLDVSSLQEVIEQLAALQQQSQHWDEDCALLETLTAPAAQQPTSLIETAVCELEHASKELDEQQKLFESFGGALDIAAEELRAAAQGQSCAVCGAELDPDRVVQQAVSGLGDHAHA